MAEELLRELTDTTEDEAVALMRERTSDVHHQPGAFCWGKTEAGRLLEVLFTPTGVVAAAGLVAEELVSGRKPASNCYPTKKTIKVLRSSPPGENIEDLLDRLLGGGQRDGLAHLGTRLGNDGSQVRGYALPDTTVLDVTIGADGGVRQIAMLSGYAGYGRLFRASRESWKLPELHLQAVRVRTFGEAYAHARSHRSAVLSVREHFDANPRVVLLCEEPKDKSATWFPRFASDGPNPASETRRFTRTYKIADRRTLDITYMGPGVSPLGPTPWALLASVLASTANDRTPSQGDQSVANAALVQLLAFVPEDADRVPDELFDTKVKQMVRGRLPQYFERKTLLTMLDPTPPERKFGLKARSEEDVVDYLRARGVNTDVVERDTSKKPQQWVAYGPGKSVTRMSIELDPSAAPLLDDGQRKVVAESLLMGVPTRTDLMVKARLDHIAAQLEKSASLHEIPGVSDFLNEVRSATPATADVGDTPVPAPLTAGSRRQLLRELQPLRPVPESLQAAANRAVIVLTSLGNMDAGHGRAQVFTVVTEATEPVGHALLCTVVDDKNRLLGYQLLEGADAQQQHRVLAERVSGNQEAAEASARASAALLAGQLQTLLEAAAADPSVVADLAPRPGDAKKAFTGELADALEAEQEALWDNPEGLLKVSPGQTAVRVDIAPVGALANDHPLASAFPGAYKTLASEGYLEQGRVWATWVHHAPGKKNGMRYDGLVWLDDHWAWFPKPWRTLRRLQQ